MSVSELLRVKIVSHGLVETADDAVVIESPLSVRINGSRLTTMMCSPVDLNYLVTGYLLSSGIIDSASEIETLDINAVDGIADVVLPGYDADQFFAAAVTSGCGRGEVYLEVIRHCRRNMTELLLDPAVLQSQMAFFNKSSELFMATGGVHSAALSTGREMIFLHEDIGRHNAVDKVIGHAASCNVPLGDKVLLSSGRLSSEILLKAARRGIPVIVSRSAPTTLAVDLALRLNITMIGFARGNRMNIYAGESRIDA
ncbi:MAG TPA: formate dehydrogenase accessory sulfurtransferase FdhD [Bacillota bacterium]|nr:formate dehydrogenase accessory sulfurtransferase FdhD [Bacillota bacterium]